MAIVDRAWMNVSGTPGTGDIALGTVVAGNQSFTDAGAADGTQYPYVAIDGNNFEIGSGTPASGVTVFQRTTVSRSVVAGVAGTSKLNLSSAAQIYLTVRAADLTDASNLISGTVGTGRLGSGAANSGTFLRGDSTWQAVVVPIEATQAEMEAATNTVAFVSPRSFKWSPFALKAWCKWGVTTTIDASAGVSSITDNGNGDWTVNWSTAFSSANYAVVSMTEIAGTATTSIRTNCIRSGGQATGSVRIVCLDDGTFGLADPVKNHVMAAGDQ